MKRQAEKKRKIEQVGINYDFGVVAYVSVYPGVSITKLTDISLIIEKEAEVVRDIVLCIRRAFRSHLNSYHIYKIIGVLRCSPRTIGFGCARISAFHSV